ncbi:hypothetical protein HZB69_03065 [Candidatus Amesbacteria bacterium]|nr:hypothetical protein [Candidatus Amesbacteria bacterium]
MIRLVRDLELFKKVEIARKLGRSYSDLNKEFKVSKSALSSWFSSSKWSSDIKTSFVIRNNEHNKDRLMAMNKAKAKYKLARYTKYQIPCFLLVSHYIGARVKRQTKAEFP